MSYIVCRNCKNFFEVDESQPLSYEKCEKCGHTLEFAGDYPELRMILDNIQIPEIKYNKICASCNAINPRESPFCKKCGSTEFYLQYDMESIRRHNDAVDDVFQNSAQNPNGPTIVVKQVNFSPKKSILFRIISLMIGLIDFFFFTMIGIQLLFGSSEVPTDILAFVSQNLTPLMVIISLSLILSGILSIMVFPKMSYRDSAEVAATIGLVVGLSTVLVSKDFLVVLVSIVYCIIFSAIGGLLGEFIVNKIFRRS